MKQRNAETGVRNTDWIDVKLGDVAEIDRTGVKPTEMHAGERYLGLEHIQKGGKICNEVHSAEGLKSTKFKFSTNHILFGKLRPYLKKVAIPPFEGVCSTDIFPILPTKVDQRFLYHFLSTEKFINEATKACTGANLPRVGPEFFRNFAFRIPRSITEQKRIAAILDAADELRTKRRETIAQLDALLQSTFLEMFGDPVTNPMGWDVVPLPSISDVFVDGPFGSNLKSEHYTDDGVRVIRLQNIGIGELLNDDVAYISEEHFLSLPRNHCKPGDVIIGTMGEPNLRACILPRDIERALNKADCLLLRVKSEMVSQIFICHLLNNEQLVTRSLQLVRGQTRGRISLGRLKGLHIPLPPMPLQDEFNNSILQIEKFRSDQKQQENELDTLFASLQSRAFRGEL